jgi:hypothetical protein
LAVAGATGLQLRSNVEGAFARASSAAQRPLLGLTIGALALWRYQTWGLDQDKESIKIREVP